MTRGTVFKYYKINKFLESVFFNNEIWHSNPIIFNDPFDCKAIIKKNTNAKRIEKYFKSVKLDYSDEKINLVIKESIKNPDKLKEILQYALEFKLKQIGISCFSLTHDNLLMWAHYTDSYKGVVLEFDIKYDQIFFKDLVKVNYTRKFPKIDLVRRMQKAINYVITTKSNEWKYENEYRSMKKAAGGYKFKKESLRSVILGSNTEDKDYQYIKQLLEDNGYDHVNIEKAKINKTKYKLDFEYLIRRNL